MVPLDTAAGCRAQARSERRVDRSELNVRSNVLTTAGRDIAEKRHRMRFRRKYRGASAQASVQASNIDLSRSRICEDLATEDIRRKTRLDFVSSGKGWAEGSTKYEASRYCRW